MNKNISFLTLITTLTLSFVAISSAAGVYISIQGGTGTSTPSGILYGDNGLTSHLNTVSIGSGLSFSGGVLSSTVSDPTFGTTSISALYPLNWNTSNAQLSTVATSSLNLEIGSFLSPNISQWTNDSNYLTSLTGSSLTKGNIIVGDDSNISQATSTVKITSTGNLSMNRYSLFAQITGLDTDTGLGFDGPDILSLHTGGVNRLYINASGEVSIATTSTSDTLAIQGLGSSNIIEAYNSSGSSKFIVKSTGNVGVGTTTPGSLFSVQGNGLFSGNLSVAGLTATGNVNFSSLSSGLLGNNNGLLYGSIATTSASCAGTLSCTSFDILGSSPITLTGSGLTAYDAWTHPAYGGSATTSILTTTGGLLATATSTFNSTLDLGSATVKIHTYPGFSFPPGAKVATTTTATTSIALGTAYVAQTITGIECWSGAGTVSYQLNDGTNQMNSLLATTTASRFAVSTNNSYTKGEKRFMDIGAMTGSYLSCSIDIIYNQ